MILFIILSIIVLCFSMVILFGAPYVPTLKPQIDAAFDLLELKKGQTLLELGCGDGRVMIEALKRGYIVIGYELNPILALIAWARTRAYRSKSRVVWGNFWNRPLLKCDGVFVFLHTRFMDKLDRKLETEKLSPIRLASFAFKIDGKNIVKEKAGVFLYKY